MEDLIIKIVIAVCSMLFGAVLMLIFLHRTSPEGQYERRLKEWRKKHKAEIDYCSTRDHNPNSK